jgi:hypothetical protein
LSCSQIIFGTKFEFSGTNWVEKTPIYIFSTFGSKIDKFERKKWEKTKKFQKPKRCKQLPQQLIHTVFQNFHMENQDNQLLVLQLLKIILVVQTSRYQNFLWVFGKKLWNSTTELTLVLTHEDILRGVWISNIQVKLHTVAAHLRAAALS